jgi:iron complex outermembrane receptor protein
MNTHHRAQRAGGLCLLPCAAAVALALTALPAAAQTTQPAANAPTERAAETSSAATSAGRPPRQLERVVVEGKRDSAEDVAGSATRNPTPVEQTPQSIVVVTRRLIEEQDAQTLSDALKNVSNIRTVDQRDLNNGFVLIRGFRGSVMLDGISVPGYFNPLESLVDVERIEVVKGPAGSLYGGLQAVGTGGFAGGVVSVETLAPQAAPSYGAGVRVGSYADRGAYVDLNQPLTGSAAMRLAAETQSNESETERYKSRRASLFPSFSWRPNGDSQLSLKVRHSDVTASDYSGLPARGTVVPAAYSIPRERLITAEGVPHTTTQISSAMLKWQQRLNDVWSWSLTGGYARAELDQRGVFPFPFGFAAADAGPTLTLAGVRLQNTFTSHTVSPAVTAKFSTGPAKHTLIAGVDWEQTRDDAFLRFSPGFGVLGTIDVTNPVYPPWAEPDDTGTPDQKNRYRSTAAYLQDQITLMERLHLLGGVRHARLRVTDVNPLFGIDNRSTNNVTTWRGGAVYELTSQLSGFVGYGEGVRVPTFAVFETAPKPEESAQTEVGLRLAQLAGLRATLAWFDLTVKNATVANGLTSIQAGEQRSRGVDLDLTWQMTPQWRWLGNYTQQKPRFVNDPQFAGKQLFNVPKRSARLAGRYDIRSGTAAGLGMGAGLTHRSALPGDSANNFFTGAATVYDAQLSYDVAPASFTLAVNNLADKKYFEPSQYFGGGQVIPATRRTVSFAASAAF